MRLLLDTHALIWWLAGDDALSNRAREAIADEANSVAVSAASAMEVATKFRIGKLPDAALLAQDFETIIADQGFVELPIAIRHAVRAGEMNITHKDPFDRLLIAQAQAEDMTLVSNEALFDGFAVKRLW
ncbi:MULTISPECIES: type II toxin-antitoxin system VapC family toxin [Bosea]|uniref:type II toxin-antitoxin system VapC family toxin n=1 Tax=Bosea TaxID=85413 RepID=UPI00214F68D6|nr:MULTISPECIES: type II toxin-antitoxin system VapC family toxin [Bosea]MCR4522049.1 type II toxin-antitoxin system VapC family toxin [Bosea sp. 47.2.35]MDR6829473.1 PIN domain nuclease of toxin-antitoxin system [Bosea robiniae]MDR6896356.1 PIN domain nuclease of toxin-antitoxin system [Bosea sp. BE109]MDR7139754.1 PIN domain nuclease of toxin-antitoxin system [Bosea sp. BE168]MDR7176524.1 PIN domain nuclease of toxin-antitoxin system [Bosea sp. BE271]